MRVVFIEDVEGVALGGDVKDVKNGFARNFLIPKRLAMPATRDTLKRTDRLKGQAEDKRLKTLRDMKALGQELNGVRVNVQMRAGASGRLYGSVTAAAISGELSKMLEREIDRKVVELPEVIRDIGTYDISVRLHAEVDATVKLLVHPMDTDPDEFLASLSASKEEEEDKSLDEQSDAVDSEETVSEVSDALPLEK